MTLECLGSYHRLKPVLRFEPLESANLRRAEDIDATKTETRSSGQKPLVIGIDFQQSVFGRTSQMLRVRSTKEYLPRERFVNRHDPVIDGGRQREPPVGMLIAVQQELLQNLPILSGAEDAFSKLAMNDANQLCISVDAASNRSPGRKSPDFSQPASSK